MKNPPNLLRAHSYVDNFPSGTSTSAPTDGQLYAQQNGVWVPVQTMQGASIANQAYYVREDFTDFDFSSSAQPARWLVGGATSWGQNPADAHHFGQLGVPAGDFLMYNPAVTDAITLVSQSFSLLKFAIVRWVLLMTGNTVVTSNNEWWTGFMNSQSSQQQGALLSFAIGAGYSNTLPNANGQPGFVDNTKGLLAGTYNGASAGHLGYIQTNYMPKPNVWLDLIVVYTPTVNRFYCGPYGSPPPLVATIHDNICQGPSLPGVANKTGTDNIELYVDFCELLYEVADPAVPARFRGYDLASL